MQHYLRCPLLWKLLEELTGLTLSEPPSHRMCLTAQLRDTSVIALGHSMYHALKIGNPHLSRQVVEHILTLASDLGKAVASELMLCGASTRG